MLPNRGQSGTRTRLPLWLLDEDTEDISRGPGRYPVSLYRSAASDEESTKMEGLRESVAELMIMSKLDSGSPGCPSR
jgi:hypothetical protein